MGRTSIARIALPLGLGALGSLVTISLSACTPVNCAAAKIADNVIISATSATHPHLLMSLCDPSTCTTPLNASSNDRGSHLLSTPTLALYATSTDHWRVAVLDSSDNASSSDPKHIAVDVYAGRVLLASRTVTPSWRPAEGDCADYTTAPEIHLTLP